MIQTKTKKNKNIHFIQMETLEEKQLQEVKKEYKKSFRAYADDEGLISFLEACGGVQNAIQILRINNSRM